MGTTQTARMQLLFEIEQLSGRYLAELESFVQYLKFKQAGTEQPQTAEATLCRRKLTRCFRLSARLRRHPLLKQLTTRSIQHYEENVY